jgi:hypothetical protein
VGCFSDKEQSLEKLYTPFGQILTDSAILISQSQAIAKEFLATMDWDIRDVTNEIRVCEYTDKDENGKPKEYYERDFKKETYPGSKLPPKLYLVTRVGNVRLPPPTSKLKIYDHVGGHSYEADKELLKKLEWN